MGELSHPSQGQSLDTLLARSPPIPRAVPSTETPSSLHWPHRHDGARLGTRGRSAPRQAVDGRAVCCPRKDTLCSLLPPSLLETQGPGNPRVVGNAPSVQSSGRPHPCLQGAFWEEVSSRRSGRRRPWLDVHRAAVRGARPPDVQEPGPPMEVPAHSHEFEGQVGPALKPAADELWVSRLHF